MYEKKGLDRRTIRTKSMIYKAFLTLLQHKSYDEISVVDIAEKADINRSTFYSHFIDKEDLLDKMIAEKMGLLSTIMQNTAGFTLEFHTPDPLFLTLFEHVFEHAYFYQVMLLSTTAGDFHTKLYELVREAFFTRISKLEVDQKLQIPLDLVLDHISFSTCGIVEKWLSNHKIYSPHHMALQLTSLAINGIYKSLGIV